MALLHDAADKIEHLTEALEWVRERTALDEETALVVDAALGMEVAYN